MPPDNFPRLFDWNFLANRSMIPEGLVGLIFGLLSMKFGGKANFGHFLIFNRLRLVRKLETIDDIQNLNM